MPSIKGDAPNAYRGIQEAPLEEKNPATPRYKQQKHEPVFTIYVIIIIL